MWYILADALWFILPAYVANSAAIDVSAIPSLKKYSTPIDGCKTFRGRRILGDGKTWRGLAGGVATGTIFRAIQTTIEASLNWPLVHMTVTLAFFISLGALTGDMVKSFFKRQAGLKRGAPVPFVDQLDYIVGAFVFSLPWVPFDLVRFILVVLLTIQLNVLANLIAYKIRIKDVWW